MTPADHTPSAYRIDQDSRGRAVLVWTGTGHRIGGWRSREAAERCAERCNRILEKDERREV